MLALCQFSTDDTSGKKNIKDRSRWPSNKESQRNWYKHDNDVNLIIRTTSEAELKNAADKDQFNTLTLKSAKSLFKNYKTKERTTINGTKQFMNYLAKNLDGRSFTLLNKCLSDLR